MTADPREVRRHAAALRRAADRLTILRLRLANGLTELARAPDPSTPAEALARAQLLLDFPPAADKAEDWRATIQSQIGRAHV